MNREKFVKKHGIISLDRVLCQQRMNVGGEYQGKKNVENCVEMLKTPCKHTIFFDGPAMDGVHMQVNNEC